MKRRRKINTIKVRNRLREKWSESRTKGEEEDRKIVGWRARRKTG